MNPAPTSTAVADSPKPSIFGIFVIGIIGLALFFFITQWLRSTTTASTDPEDPARDAERVKNLADLRAEDQAKLTTYAWVDRAKGSVQIPLDQAMNLVIPTLNASKPRPAYPIDPASLPADPNLPADATPAPAQKP